MNPDRRNLRETMTANILHVTNGTAVSPGMRSAGIEGTIVPSIDQVLPLVKRALKVLNDREVSPQLGLLKSTLLQLDSSFSERDYGASTFRDFAEKLEQRGLVALKHSGRTTIVELSDTAGDGGLAPAPRASRAGRRLPKPATVLARRCARPRWAGPPSRSCRSPTASRSCAPCSRNRQRRRDGRCISVR